MVLCNQLHMKFAFYDLLTINTEQWRIWGLAGGGGGRSYRRRKNMYLVFCGDFVGTRGGCPADPHWCSQLFAMGGGGGARPLNVPTKIIQM